MTSQSPTGPRRHTPAYTASVAAAAALSIACHGGTTTPTVGTLSPQSSTTPAVYDASRDLGPLFHDVQMARVFPDSKTFVDSRPRSAPETIAALYLTERAKPGFDLEDVRGRALRRPASGRGGGDVGHRADDGGAHHRALAVAHATGRQARTRTRR